MDHPTSMLKEATDASVRKRVSTKMIASAHSGSSNLTEFTRLLTCCRSIILAYGRRRCLIAGAKGTSESNSESLHLLTSPL